ncbi:MAG: pyridine nucleotide-disulfide oxidoreductase [Gammaproteobacteria bacterium]|nr:pyridine nucleotide-disulfide oxidoreductase [Gammaproteobacteria bacterium]MBV9697927.1 pyridine nucleotide-disulfide oxidoreductase [Gammaproteobacteria bacterium]
MSAQPNPRPEAAEPDEELLVRRVRLGELHGTARAPAAAAPAVMPEAAAPAARAPAPAPRQAPAPAARPTAPARAPEPATPPQPVHAPGTARAPVARPGLATAARSRSRRLFTGAVVALLIAGWLLPTEHYITPKRGVGYALGIIGGSLMLILLLYSARKRYEWLRFLGATPSWFRFHMVLGIFGPLCILYHANFSTGATNSNVALFCMLIVAGSGIIGRYIYNHIHQGLYGRKLELHELRASAEGLKSLSSSVSFLPELVGRLEHAERRLLASGPRAALLGIFKPTMVAGSCLLWRWRLHRYVRSALRAGARKSAVLASEQRRLRSVACAYIDRRLAASRKVAGFEGYERLFSLWHALHIPLMFMMILAAIIHVIAVHVY